MQSVDLIVGQTVAVTAEADDSQGAAVTTAVGNAVLSQDANTGVAHRSNGSGSGLEQDITADAPGNTVFTLTGHKSDGVTPFASSFQVNVTVAPVDEPVTYKFTFGTPTP
jgi:hypothetical protein